MAPVNPIGQIFHRLTIVSRHPQNTSDGKSRWICSCSCGNTTVVALRDLRKGKTRSCGCLKTEMLHSDGRKQHLDVIRSTKHGMYNTSEYRIWQNMKKRCYSEKSKGYPDYGARGITVCDEWKESFEAFYRDVGPRPSPHHTLDRRDNDKGYDKENCRWATWEEQANNRRNNIFHVYQGVARTLAGWIKEFNLDYQQAYSRYYQYGWTIEEIIAGKRD